MQGRDVALRRRESYDALPEIRGRAQPPSLPEGLSSKLRFATFTRAALAFPQGRGYSSELSFGWLERAHLFLGPADLGFPTAHGQQFLLAAAE